MKHRNWKRLVSFLCALMLLSSMTACGGNASRKMTGATQTEEGYTQLDILANINMDTLTQDGNCVYFDVYVSPELSVRFGGVGVTVEEEALVIEPHSYLFSMEYMGGMILLDIEGDDPYCGFNLGIVYANSSSVTSLDQFHAAFPYSIDMQRTPIDLTSCSGGFFTLALSPQENQPTRIHKLVLTYDPSVPQTLYGQISDNALLDVLNLYVIDWQPILGGTFLGSEDFFTIAENKMAEAGSIESDIVAGIDYDSITTDGDSTWFTSVMSNGEIIRFVGTGITVDEAGITMAPGAELSSLDALGRIYLYTVGSSTRTSNMDDCMIEFGYGYTYSASKTSVDSADMIHSEAKYGSLIRDLLAENRIPTAILQPNFVCISTREANTHDVTLSSLIVGYNPEEKVTEITEATLDSTFTTAYLSGDLYNLTLEDAATSPEGSLEFYLILKPDTGYGNFDNSPCYIAFIPGKFVEIGDLKNENGEVVDKLTARIQPGYTLDVRVGDFTVTLDLVVKERYAGATTLHELQPYGTLNSFGSVNTLVVPIGWADQLDNASSANYARICKAMGRVEDLSGEVTDHSDPDDQIFSVSEYFDTASYGKCNFTSFVTDWYIMDENYSDMADAAPASETADKIVRWVKATYPDLDWAHFDQNGDGYIDSLILINAGTRINEISYSSNSYAGGVMYTQSQMANLAGTQDDPTVNLYASVNYSWIEDGTLVHEISHQFGLIDYYDVTYAGGDAVGGFDMQSHNVGDWNAYSKLAVGWMDPQIVTGLASGESVELTIGSSALTDDVIVIPAAGNTYDGPFGEYIMIDLFSDDGLNTYDAKKWDLSGVDGVRITHVDANMETWILESAAGAYTDEQATYLFGTAHRTNAYNLAGLYHVEVIQSGGVNTFTNLEQECRSIQPDDFFYAGDTFTMADYSDFFENGLMDDGSDFGYSITIVSIGTDAEGNPTATIRITAD